MNINSYTNKLLITKIRDNADKISGIKINNTYYYVDTVMCGDYFSDFCIICYELINNGNQYIEHCIDSDFILDTDTVTLYNSYELFSTDYPKPNKVTRETFSDKYL